MKFNEISKTLLASLAIASASLVFTSCDDDPIYEPEPGGGKTDVVKTLDFYVLNEGGYGLTNSSLDFYNSTSDSYTAGIFASANPSADAAWSVGNDLKTFGSRVYAVLNGSGKVVAVSAADAKLVGEVAIEQPRSVAGKDGYIYVSSYASTDGAFGPGSVAKVDTLTLRVVDRIDVGYEPEDLAVKGNKLYVANSGGYHSYSGHTVTVIDLNSFTVSKEIDVTGVNLHHLALTADGNLLVSARGNYYDKASALYVVNTTTDALTRTIEQPVSDIAVYGNTAYAYAQTYDANWNATYSCFTIDLDSWTVGGSFIQDATQIATPYELAVNPNTGEIVMCDAGDYTTAGSVLYFNADGSLKWKHSAGVIPGHVAFK